MAQITAKAALSHRQVVFCERVVASDGYDLGAHYKRTHLYYREDDQAWVLLQDEDLDPRELSASARRQVIEQGEPVPRSEWKMRAQELLQHPTIARYIKELQGGRVELAEGVLTEQLLVGDPKERLKASEKILEDRDRVGFREGVERFWEVSREAGATVVVPLPGEARAEHRCASCGHAQEVVIPIASRFPGGAADAPTLEVSVSDLENHGAYLEYSPEAKIRLAEMAGAPWSEIDPNAKLSDLQREHLGHRERIKIVHGGSGVGKSVIGAVDALVATMIPGDIVGVIGAMYDNVEKEFRYVDRGFRKLFPNKHAFLRIACISRNNYHDFEVSPIWGSECFGYSMESNDGRSALGDTMHHATISEGAQLSSAILNKRVLRALDRAVMIRPGVAGPRETGTLTIPTTPDEHRGAGCSAELIEERRRATKRDLSKLAYGRVKYESTFWFREASVLENPNYNPEVYRERKATMKRHEFEEVYEGRMTNASGRVYHQWSESRHVIAMPTRVELQAMRFGLGLDTGAHFAAVLVGLDRKKRLYWLGEATTEKETIEVSARAVVTMLEDVLPVELSAEMSEDERIERLLERIDLHVPDPASQFKVDLADRLPGFRIDSPTRDEGKFDLMATISQIGELFENERLFVVETCDLLIDELRKYSWKSQRSPSRQGQYMVKEPARDNDHCLDAARYVTVPLSQMNPLEQVTQESLRDAYEELAHRRIHQPLRKILDHAERVGGLWV